MAGILDRLALHDRFRKVQQHRRAHRITGRSRHADQRARFSGGWLRRCHDRRGDFFAVLTKLRRDEFSQGLQGFARIRPTAA